MDVMSHALVTQCIVEIMCFFYYPLKRNKSKHYSHFSRFYNHLCLFENLCHMPQKGFVEISK